MRKKTFSINIYSERWKYRVISQESWNDQHPENALAITKRDECEMEFSPGGVVLTTVRHELFHAYCKYLFLGSTESIKYDDLEEIYAEMLEHNWERMNTQANAMYEKLKGEMEYDKERKKVRRRKASTPPPAMESTNGSGKSDGHGSGEVRGLQLSEGDEVEQAV